MELINFFKHDRKSFIGLLIFITSILLEYFVFKSSNVYLITLYMLSYILVGVNILKVTWNNLLKGDIFDENFLMSIASIGAFILGHYEESITVILFYKIGEYFQEVATQNAEKNIKTLLDKTPTTAHLITENSIKTVSTSEVAIGSTLSIQPGEKIPLDGVIISGTTAVNTSSLTGESMPKGVEIGDEVYAGYINGSGLITIKTTKLSDDTIFARLMHMVKNNFEKKSKSEKFITKFARFYTPIVIYIAICVAIIPPIVLTDSSYSTWIYRALIFLVISCPCALMLSVPLSFFAGIAASASKGIFVKGGECLDAQAYLKNIVFDKTGTLTTGEFVVENVILTGGLSKNDVLEVVGIVESNSNHPVAKCLVKYCKDAINNIPQNNFLDYKDIPGYGIKATDKEGRTIVVGNHKLAKQNTSDDIDSSIGNVYLIINSKLVAIFKLRDKLADSAKDVISKLRQSGIKNITLLSGDNKQAVEAVAKELDIEDYGYEMLPEDKMKRLEDVMSKSNGKTAFVGDGVNDSPSLALADIGYAMGGGSDSAIETGDIVLIDSKLSKLPLAINISKYTRKIAYQNIYCAVGIKVVIMIVGLMGEATMWAAIFADVGVSILTILNSLRVMRRFSK